MENTAKTTSELDLLISNLSEISDRITQDTDIIYAQVNRIHQIDMPKPEFDKGEKSVKEPTAPPVSFTDKLRMYLSILQKANERMLETIGGLNKIVG